MSDLSNQSLKVLAQGDLQEAEALARAALKDEPDDWHCHYALGQCLRFAERFREACQELDLALHLAGC